MQFRSVIILDWIVLVKTIVFWMSYDIECLFLRFIIIIISILLINTIVLFYDAVLFTIATAYEIW